MTLTKKQQVEFKKKYPDVYNYWVALKNHNYSNIQKMDNNKIESQLDTILKLECNNKQIDEASNIVFKEILALEEQV